jgi:hypothetical protein
MSAHDTVVSDVLAAAYRRLRSGHEAIDTHTPLDALMREEEGMPADERVVRAEAFRAILADFFADGPHPAKVMRRVFALTKAYAPELILNMTCQDLGNMFGETRAAVSWRINQLHNKRVKAAGANGTHVRFQKSETTRAKYRLAAKGNKNRAKGAKAKRAA